VKVASENSFNLMSDPCSVCEPNFLLPKMLPKSTNDFSARYIHINEIVTSISYIKACLVEVQVPDIEHGVTTTVNTDVMIVIIILGVHVVDVIHVGGMLPVEDDRSDEDAVAVLMGATVVLLLVDGVFDDDEVKAEGRNGLLLVFEVLLVVGMLVVAPPVGKASSWYIFNAYTPPQSSRCAP
jgi:hypothetical protein